MTEEITSTPPNIPIIILHKGDHEYLSACLEALSRCERRVIILGDASNAASALRFGAEHFDIADYTPLDWGDEFVYKHNSRYDANFERFCFERFLVIRNFVCSHDINKFIYIDSDIVIMNKKILENFDSYMLSYDLACLSKVSTFFAGWSKNLFNAFVESFRYYFPSEPWGDRHCDMNALRKFIDLHWSHNMKYDIAEELRAYCESCYSFDPNYGFAPFMMKHLQTWDYEKVSTAEIDLNEMIYSDGKTHYISVDCYLVELDFVHLNGFSKKFASYFRDVVTGRHHNPKVEKLARLPSAASVEK
ncbi:hypothetical protein [Methylobacterium isbiliense]|uniref:Nucleotide-diphospho-sugar transferase domain-containing protein n=1 Tax=Methylobacterium isbiliense TaxID=315478 RepID=A0ABQ4SLB8_9HYPH|nr:hypothetical protein [Methylobacterium isbiliense]MDN3625788.1 hypothetical protein [Methylobacterium isbiliense]GJE02538.1 hypothetical protein GMJLKIPL_4487 [Methylobacterium isbiliense]